MGNTDKLKIDEASTENPKVGNECTKVPFSAESGWAGIVWQHPAGDWGDAPGGFDLTGATTLNFWIRGKLGAPAGKPPPSTSTKLRFSNYAKA